MKNDSSLPRPLLGLLVSMIALGGCAPASVKSSADAGRDIAGTGGVQPGTGGTQPGTGGTIGTGGVVATGGARDAASTSPGDASPDLPVAPDTSGSADLTATPDTKTSLDVPIDQASGGIDGQSAIDSNSEAAPPAGPTTYYVATTGSDQGAGTLAAPFATIQHCATLARPGDRCVIRAGTYRETVTPARSGTSSAHISFEAYQGECVTVNGADVLNVTWQKYQGSIYAADTSLRFIQLFANGKMMNEARWPNADPDDLVHAPLAQAGPGTTETSLEGPTLPAGDWTGAYVFSIPGQRWTSYTRKIESYDQAKKIATWTLPMRESTAIPALAPRARDTYYVFGSLLALDTAGEWFQDPTTGKVHLWAPGSVDPTTLKIEVKQRDYGFNLGGRSYVDVKGIRLFATSVRMLGASHCVVDGVHARYVSHLRETNGYATGNAAGTWTATGTGLVVNISNPGKSALRVGIHGPNAATDANQRWCVVLTVFDQPVLIPWGSFNTACWDYSGASYAKQPLSDVVVSVPGSNTVATPFSFCINGMAPKLDLGEGSPLEDPLWTVLPGGTAANADWQGYVWTSSGGTGTTLTPPDFSAAAANNKLCLSGSVAATTDYSGYAEVGANTNHTLFASTAPVLFGDADEWRNGSIAYSAVSGITAPGRNGKVVNNVVHDVGYLATSFGGIAIQSNSGAPHGNEVSGNSVSRTGSVGIGEYADATARLLHNRVSQAMQLNDDGGLIYSWGTTATSAEIAYNDVSDIPCIYGTGIYLDDGSNGFVVHHNLIRRTSYYGVSLKMPNQFVNNTILGTPLGAGSIYKNNNDTWVDLSSAVFSNNLIEQRLGIFFFAVQKQTTDACDYQTVVPVTKDWQKVTLPFSSLAQQNWGIREGFDPTNVTRLDWVIGTEGAYEIDLDDVWLEGTTPKLLDDFDHGSTNSLGGSWWGGASSGSTGTSSTTAGYTGNALAVMGASVVEGYAAIQAHLAADGTSPADLSAYTGVSFRIRGTATLNLSHGTATTTPAQAHNLDCPVDANGVPTSICPVDQGGLFTPYTDGYAGAAPDVGAFESSQTPWTAGSTTVEPTDLCPS